MGYAVETQVERFLEELQTKVEAALGEIRKRIYEDITRLEGEIVEWSDEYSKIVKDLRRRVEEVEAEVDRWSEVKHKQDEEIKSRLTRLEELSFLGSLIQLLAAAQKAGVDPKQLLEEALKRVVGQKKAEQT